jgi:hypothetical protein
VTEKEFKPYTRAEILKSLQKLPEDATVADAIERLEFLAGIEIARAQFDAGLGTPHEEIVREMAEWED